jgi:hypothetical protein
MRSTTDASLRGINAWEDPGSFRELRKFLIALVGGFDVAVLIKNLTSLMRLRR